MSEMSWLWNQYLLITGFTDVSTSKSIKCDSSICKPGWYEEIAADVLCLKVFVCSGGAVDHWKWQASRNVAICYSTLPVHHWYCVSASILPLQECHSICNISCCMFVLCVCVGLKQLDGKSRQPIVLHTYY